MKHMAIFRDPDMIKVGVASAIGFAAQLYGLMDHVEVAVKLLTLAIGIVTLGYTIHKWRRSIREEKEKRNGK